MKITVKGLYPIMCVVVVFHNQFHGFKLVRDETSLSKANLMQKITFSAELGLIAN